MLFEVFKFQVVNSFCHSESQLLTGHSIFSPKETSDIAFLPPLIFSIQSPFPLSVLTPSFALHSFLQHCPSLTSTTSFPVSFSPPQSSTFFLPPPPCNSLITPCSLQRLHCLFSLSCASLPFFPFWL